ncbi:MAG TPA: glycerophosphodiester phosphodiesterase [Candidatus Korarchaeota archaeon]|nr:glycerophosphodiester phosphodiesterase [Candidatus Korarchaeota archaeon]
MDKTLIGLYKNFFIVGHRGASAYEPENTMLSVRKAFEMGADAVEVDARVSNDGYVVIIHDETVDRTTNGSGAVSDLSLEEIRALDAGKSEKIPLLEEVLEEVRDKGCLFLEIKVKEAAIPSLEIVEGREMLDSVLFISFSSDTLYSIKKASKESHIGLLYIKPVDGIVGAKRLGCEAVLPYYRLATQKAIAFAHRLKLKVIPWTVDELKTAIELKKRGVDGIATNRPDLMAELRSQRHCLT